MIQIYGFESEIPNFAKKSILGTIIADILVLENLFISVFVIKPQGYEEYVLSFCNTSAVHFDGRMLLCSDNCDISDGVHQHSIDNCRPVLSDYGVFPD